MLKALKIFLIKTIEKFLSLRGKDFPDTKETQKNKQKGTEKKALCHTIMYKTLKCFDEKKGQMTCKGRPIRTTGDFNLNQKI